MLPITAFASIKPIQLVEQVVNEKEFTMSTEGNELYALTTVTDAAGDLDDFNSFFSGTSQKPYESFIKLFPSVLKKETNTTGFASKLIKKDAKEAVFDVIKIVNHFYLIDPREKIIVARYKITNQGKNGVTLTGYEKAIPTQGSWYKTGTGNQRYTFFYDQIFSYIQPLEEPVPSNKINAALGTILTLRGIEKKYEEFHMFNYVNTGLNSSTQNIKQFVPDIELVDKEGSNVVKIIAGFKADEYFTGKPWVVNEYNTFVNNPNYPHKRSYNRIDSKSFTVFKSKKFNPDYSELIYVKSKNGKYMFSTAIKLSQYKNGKEIPVTQATLKKYEKDIVAIRNEMVSLIKSLDNNPKLYQQQNLKNRYDPLLLMVA